MRRRDVLAAAATSVVGLLAGSAKAQQDFPTRAIKIIAPYPPGGTTDLFARSIGEYLQQSLRQTVVVENRPGASGIIGATSVARSPADGYTLLIGSQALYAVHPWLNPKLPYNADTDFTPISLVGWMPSYLAVPASLPVKDMSEFLSYVRSNVGKVSYGSAGIGTAQHIYMELFKQQMGLEMLHVPYKGSAPAVTDLIAGRIQAVLDFGPSVLPFLGSGMLRLIAISTRERSRSAPDVPTMMEAGMTNFDASTWFAIHGPGGMPEATVERLAAEIKAAMQDPGIRARLEAAGAEPAGSSPAELRAVQARDKVKLGEVIRRAEIKLE
jgi:tripartite-type tricarboxylate transporter receptor subunit TctC